MRKAYLQMHISILLWGFTGIFGKAIGMNAIMIVWYRMIISAVALIPFMIKHKQFILPDRKRLASIIITGFVVCLHWLTFYASIKASNVSIALSCFASVSLFSALLEPLFYRKKIDKQNIILALFVLVGIYIIFAFQQLYAMGIILALISALLGALFTILNKIFVSNDEPAPVTFIELISGFVFLSVLLPLILPAFNLSFQIPSKIDWVWLLLLSVVCTSVAFTLSLEALKKVSAFTMNLSVNLEPLYSIVLAIILFKENELLNNGFYIGAVIVISSVFIHSLMQYRVRDKSITEQG
ncbi:MAG: EamA family transporter [Bacteroidetes bacterium]|jgi:drug/metabolite transporter (DMT)-like permease|nr:EamA family transporter [Bacteroidota bacterium]MBX7238464.1 DMT family transporter [Bacteroidia bacterium]MCW5920371.1 EamA family transporter [Bacteroidota bacterium]HMU77446.1 DMT family transporter [Bacteroidia bacterium]HMW09459.1 DMT family transporter [Bacteroidia bacterium]